PHPDELREMAAASLAAGHPEVARRLLSRGLALQDLTPGARARLQFELAYWHEQRDELLEAERLLGTARDSFEELGDAWSKARTLEQIAGIHDRRGDLDAALQILEHLLLQDLQRRIDNRTVIMDE